MAEAAELQQLSTFLRLWQVYDPAVKSDLYSTAVESGARLFLIDPVPLAADSLAELAAGARVAGVLVTNSNHPRAAASFGRQFAAPIYAAAPVVEALEGEKTVSITDGEEIFPGLTAVALPGGAPGEMAFHFAEEGGTMVVGDALIHFEPYGFALLPAKYCTDQKALRRSLRRLLDWPFERLLFAHGTPILSSARARLETLLL
ncbi:MAG: hypothetical protein ABI787_11665 [Spartobacteria bacterium]